MQGSLRGCRNRVLRDKFCHMSEEILVRKEIHEGFSERIFSVDHNRRVRIACQRAAVLYSLHIILQNSSEYIACDLRLIRLRKGI